MNKTEDIFLKLVRLGVGNEITESLPEIINWDSIKALSDKQGLSAVVLDGLEHLRIKKEVLNVVLPEKRMLTQWIGEVLQGFEYRYEMYCHAIADLASFYNSHDLKMMIIKGYACSLDWPKPDHRPTGDIDIWLFGKYKEADVYLSQEKGIEIDKKHHHHTVFYWRDFMVENHYDLLNVYQHKSNKQLEVIVKELAQDDSSFIDLYGERVYIPSADFHALFLLRHAMTHFAASEITIRQILDWAFFVKRHGEDVNWDWLIGVLKEYGMIRLFDVFNTICIENLGFDTDLFPQGHVDRLLKERVLDDILSPEFSKEEPRGHIRGLLFKYQRWWTNRWKHNICFSDSLWSAFWTGIWGHLSKPKIGN